MTIVQKLFSFIREKLLSNYERISSSIYNRVNFAMLALTLSVLLIVGVLSFGFMRQLVRENVRKTVESDAVQASLRLEHTFNAIAESMSNMASNLIITNALVDTSGRDTYIVPFMKSFKLEHNINVELTLCDFMGKPIASNVRDPQAFNSPELLERTIQEGNSFAELVNGGKDKALLIAFPVIWVMTNKPEGILIAKIKIDELFNKTLPALYVGTERTVSLLNGQNILLQKNKKPETIFFQMKRPLKLLPPLDKIGFQFEIDDYRKIKAGWLFVIYLFSGLFFIVITKWVSKKLSLMLTSRLMDLSDTAKQIAESGSLDHAVEVKGPDELKTLATAFNSMIGKVREARDNLENQIEDRTEELRMANEQLYEELKERKQAEMKLCESDKFIRNILDSVDEGFIVVDKDFRILIANKAYCSQVGQYSDIIGRPCHEISHHSPKPCYEEGEECAVRHVFATGEPHIALHRHRDSKGAILYVETKAFPIKDPSGTVISVIETVNNITEKHLLEEERLKTQKLEAIGTLAGGIAHDFNNLLQGIFGYISLAKLKAGDREKNIDALEQAETALHQTVKLTGQLLTFSKGGKPLKKIFDIRPVIANATNFALSGSSSDCHITAEDDLWYAEADDGQIGQVIQNIVLNADQAMSAGGLVNISERNVQSPGEGLPEGLQPGKYIEISIKDNGIGIPKEYLARIFDPYFTTKEKGSGLGLATSYSIIKNHGGMIGVRSEPGQGTTFAVYIPGKEAVIKDESIKPETPAKAEQAWKILVMDDEEVVRSVVGELIRALGHKVDFAVNGLETIEKYEIAENSGKPFDAIILDLTIRGGMGGLETMERLKERHPDIKAIVSTGYSDSAALAEYKKLGFAGFLMKPYTIEGLRATLNTVMKSSS